MAHLEHNTPPIDAAAWLNENGYDASPVYADNDSIGFIHTDDEAVRCRFLAPKIQSPDLRSGDNVREVIPDGEDIEAALDVDDYSTEKEKMEQRRQYLDNI